MSIVPTPANMAVTFLDVEKDRMERTNSNADLSKFNSAAATLNNTPTQSRTSSPVRGRAIEKLANRTPTPSPRHEDIEAMDKERRTRRISNYNNDELEISWMGAIIVTCFFTSGMIDAVAFNSWNCFVGMQTGNTIFAALGLGGLPYNAHDLQYVKSFIAIGSFCLGTVFFNILHRTPTGFHNQPSSRRRVIFALSFLVQTLLILVAAALVTSGVVSTQPFVVGQFSSGNDEAIEAGVDHRNYRDFIPIILLAFEASGQVCLSRVLAVIELPTIVLSTLYHDWTADLLCTRNLWSQSSGVKDFILVQGRRQHKRLACIVALFMGGVVGGEMYKSNAGMAGALWFAVALKACIVVAFTLWPKQRQDDE